MTRWMLVFGALAAVGLWSAQEARADDHRGRRHDRGGSSWSIGFNVGHGGHYYGGARYYRPNYYYSAPRYVAPPTYYYPRTYYYYSPPTYYYSYPQTYYYAPPIYRPRSGVQFYFRW